MAATDRRGQADPDRGGELVQRRAGEEPAARLPPSAGEGDIPHGAERRLTAAAQAEARYAAGDQPVLGELPLAQL